MKITLGGKELEWESYQHRQALTEYAASLQVMSRYPILEKVTIEEGSHKFDMVPTGHTVKDMKYISILRPEKFVNLASEIIPPFKGDYTTEEILQQVGFETVSLHATNKVYWEFPSLTYKEFIEHLEYHTSINEGGGCFINVSLEGFAIVTDLKSMAYREDIVLHQAGEFTQYEKEIAWMHDYPGSYQLIQHFPEGSLQREIEFEEGFGKGRVIEIITSEKLKDMKVRFLRNQFYRRFFFKTQTYLNAVAPVQTLLGAPLRTQNTTGLIAEFTIDSGSSGLYKIIY